MGYPPNAQHELFGILMRYSDRDPDIPERKDGNTLARLLSEPDGRAKYQEWQREHAAVWSALKTHAHQLVPLACGICKGTGTVALFTSLAECSDCHPPKSDIRWTPEGADQSKRYWTKSTLISGLLHVPKGRRLLAEALETVRKKGCLDSPLKAMGMT